MGRQFKTITLDNWLDPDRVSSMFARVDPVRGQTVPVTANDWAARFLAVSLDSQIPEEVRDLFEVARGVCLYAWFFYPLYHLGEEQLFRVGDTAVAAKCAAMNGPKDASFKARLDWLLRQGVIDVGSHFRWDAVRNLRNIGSHPDFQSLHPPASVLTSFMRMADRINALFR
jgi:hypothetical protein